MLSSHLIGIILAIISAITWGIGDFSGGYATRRNNHFQVLVLVSSTGLIFFLLLVLIKGEPFPSVVDVFWAAGAGFLGVFGIAALYVGLSSGSAAIVAPTGAVIGAGIPVLVGIALQGFPNLFQLSGFGLGILGIWLVAGSSSEIQVDKKRDLSLALAAGIGFGGYFVLITRVGTGAIFYPLAIAKSVALIVAVSYLAIHRMKPPSLKKNPAALLAGLLDASGNLFYLLAFQFTRLDVAAVLSCMAPAVTVFLASRMLHEKVRTAQWLGVALCVFAVALIAL
jgi:drug/metabolite transporter (DMT)-like permease